MSSTERFTAASTYFTAKVPTRLEVNKKTGGAVLYDDDIFLNAFGRSIWLTTVNPVTPNSSTLFV